MPDECDWTLDAVLGGKLLAAQPIKGERVNIDPVLLARLCPGCAAFNAADFGAGCGVIAALLIYLKKAARVTAVEILPRQAELARRTAIANGMSGAIEILNEDLRLYATRHHAAFDLIVSNPPYFKLTQGKLPADEIKAGSRHEVNLTLAQLAEACSLAAKDGGKVCIIYPWERTAEASALFKRRGLSLASRVLIKAFADEKPKRAVITFVKGEVGEAEDDVELILHERGSADKYTADAEALLRPDEN